MNKDEILVIEDDLSTRVMIEHCLASKFKIIQALNIKMAMEKFDPANTKMILLDLYLPDGDGFDFLNQMEVVIETHHVPVLMLTLEAKPEIKAKGFSLGIYDYMVKPFSALELLSRVEAHLNRAKLLQRFDEVPLKLGEFQINNESRQVLYKNEEIHLTPLEFKLLTFFLKNNGKVVTREELAKSVWMRSYYQSRTIDRHISSVRKKLGAAAHAIETVNQLGYKFNLN